jgi:PAS domain S-box-containing protein
MNPLRSVLSTSPKAKIYRRIVAAWLLFLGLGFGFFTFQYINQRLERVSTYAELVLALSAPFVAEVAQGGREDLIQQALNTAAGSPFIKELAVTSKSVDVRWQSHVAPSELTAPSWINTWFKSKLLDIQKPLLLKGQALGALKLSFETEALANDAWHVFLLSFLFTACLAVFGVLAGLIPLSRAVQKLTALGQQAEVTLNAISEGVICCTANFELLSINPAAQRLLGFSVLEMPRLLGQDVRVLLPNLLMNNEVASNWVARDYALTRQDGVQCWLETGFADVQGQEAPSVCKVLTLRDVSHAHALASAQRRELLEHQTAMANMRKVANLLPLSNLTNVDDPGKAGTDQQNDLTDWVLAMIAEREKSLKELENQKFALDQHAMVVISDVNGLTQYVNPRYCQISGYDRAELMGQPLRLISRITNAEHFYTEMLDTVSKGKTWQGDLQSQNKEGHAYWVNVTVVPLFNEFLVQDRFMFIGTDITQDQENKTRLRAQLNLVEALLEATPLVIYSKDTLGRYVLANAAFEKFFGLTRAELIGKTAFDIAELPYAQFSLEQDQRLEATGGVQSFETSYTHPTTGRVVDLFYSKALTTDAEGQVTGIVGAIVDVTVRNQTQLLLKATIQLAETASQAKSNFLANMSHEIRTPMNGVIGMLELALDIAVDPGQREYLNLAQSSAQSLMVVINDILDISKIESNRVELEALEFTLIDFLARSLKSVEALAKKKGLAFKLECSDALPKQVIGDPLRLGQVLLNLCDNAIKFTPLGSVTVRVSATPVLDGTVELTVDVIDTGIGIAAELQSAVFDNFTQADASITRQYGGTGLGLSISSKLVDLMGGHLGLESAIGHGSTFTLKLRLPLPPPLTQAAPALVAASIQRPMLPKPAATGPLQVMLVEDNLVNQILCSTILKKIGHVVVLASHGQEALDLFAKRPWDVILMDMQMPVMDGMDATRAIRALELPGQHTPIVAMTANAMESDRQLCLDAGMDDYLSKPFKFAELKAILEKAVRRDLLSEA